MVFLRPYTKLSSEGILFSAKALNKNKVTKNKVNRHEKRNNIFI